MNVRFHGAIVEASGNHWISDFVRRTHHVPLASDRILLWDDYALILRSHDDHLRLRRVIAKGQVERAARIMKEHGTHAGDVLIQALESHDGPDRIRRFTASPEPP